MRKEVGFGDLLSKSWKEYKDSFKLLFKGYFWLYFIPGLILLTLSLIFISPYLTDLKLGDNSAEVQLIANILASSVSSKVLISLLFFGILSVLFKVLLSMTTYYISLNGRNGKAKFGEMFSKTYAMFWSLLGLFIVVVLALIPLFILLIIPGVIFSVYWSLSAYVMIKEKTGIIESMRRSYRYVKGKWWLTFGYILLMFLIVIAIGMIVSIPSAIISIPYLIGFVSGNVSPGYFSFLQVVDFLTGFVSSLISMPLMIFFFKNYYLSLSGKK